MIGVYSIPLAIPIATAISGKLNMEAEMAHSPFYICLRQKHAREMILLEEVGDSIPGCLELLAAQMASGDYYEGALIHIGQDSEEDITVATMRFVWDPAWVAITSRLAQSPRHQEVDGEAEPAVAPALSAPAADAEAPDAEAPDAES